MSARMQDGELMIDTDLVRSLLRRDLAAYAELPLRPLDSTGSTNRLFRLGELAANLAVATPEVLTVGEPGFGYPERWSVARWRAETSRR